MDNQNITVDSMNDEARIRLADSLSGKGAHIGYEAAIQDFPENLMNNKPNHVPYSFWHQLEHIRIAQYDMLEYIRNPDWHSPEWPHGYWPQADNAIDAEGWNNTIQQYRSDLEEFISLIDNPSVNLLQPVTHLDNRSVFRCVLVIVDHTAYHLGEFVMARQIMGAWQSELNKD